MVVYLFNKIIDELFATGLKVEDFSLSDKKIISLSQFAIIVTIIRNIGIPPCTTIKPVPAPSSRTPWCFTEFPDFDGYFCYQSVNSELNFSIHLKY